jgi:predicted DNA-binding transcriptional regulator YafY
MSKQEYISRYLLIINYLKRGQANWSDVLNHLKTQSEITGYNYVISQRTFQRDINEIGSLWNFEIQNNKSTGYYILAQEKEDNENFQLLDSFNLYNALSLSNNYSQLIEFETRIPKGTEHIYGLLHTIKNRFVIELNYHKFYEDEAEKVVVHPYLVKQFKGRWYLLCIKESSGKVRTYGLDRIIDFDIRKKKYVVDKELNLAEKFKSCFGIITPEELKPERVVFSLSAEQAKYIITYPLHVSQRVVKETRDEVTFEITVYITYDLLMELLGLGEQITIISPKKLIKEYTAINKNILNKY